MKFVSSIIRLYYALWDVCFLEKKLRSHIQFGREYVRACEKDDRRSPIQLDAFFDELIERYVRRMNELTLERFALAEEELVKLHDECCHYVQHTIGSKENMMSLAKRMVNVEDLADFHASITARQLLEELSFETQEIDEVQEKEVRRRICFRYRFFWGNFNNKA